MTSEVSSNLILLSFCYKNSFYTNNKRSPGTGKSILLLYYVHMCNIDMFKDEAKRFYLQLEQILRQINECALGTNDL